MKDILPVHHSLTVNRNKGILQQGTGRIYKHLWKCNNGECVNADVNDSYQIMRKVYPQLFDNGVEGYLKDPKVIDIKIGRDKGDVKK